MLMWKKTSRVTPWGDNIFHFSETYYAGVSNWENQLLTQHYVTSPSGLVCQKWGKYIIAIKQRKTPEKMMTVP
jgi:hypothetical protein